MGTGARDSVSVRGRCFHDMITTTMTCYSFDYRLALEANYDPGMERIEYIAHMRLYKRIEILQESEESHV